MGTNDHIPSRSTRTSNKRRGQDKEPVLWSQVDKDTLHAFISTASDAGAYVAFGTSRDRGALLLYIKHGDWSERLAFESPEEAVRTLVELEPEF